MKTASVVHYSLGPREVKKIRMSPNDVANYQRLSKLGINFSPAMVGEMHRGLGFDTNDVGLSPAPLTGLTTNGITTPIQFLQAWLPGFIPVVTAARKIDELCGIQTVGSWEDEQIVQGILERRGTAVPYSDSGNVPLTNWNTEFIWRTVVRFEIGMQVGALEEARSARIRIASAAEKRAQAAEALEIQRNRVGFYGFNDGAGLTYGFLNDPNLPNYQGVTTDSNSKTLWSQKNFQGIVADILLALQGLRTNSMSRIDPKKDPITMAVAQNKIDYLATTTDFGISVQDWLTKNYPNVRVESAPELQGANSSADVAYFYAERIEDGGSDGGMVMSQLVPSKFTVLGVEKRAKGYVEDYTASTAGFLLKRAYAVYRLTGI